MPTERIDGPCLFLASEVGSNGTGAVCGWGVFSAVTSENVRFISSFQREITRQKTLDVPVSTLEMTVRTSLAAWRPGVGHYCLPMRMLHAVSCKLSTRERGLKAARGHPFKRRKVFQVVECRFDILS